MFFPINFCLCSYVSIAALYSITIAIENGRGYPIVGVVNEKFSRALRAHYNKNPPSQNPVSAPVHGLFLELSIYEYSINV